MRVCFLAGDLTLTDGWGRYGRELIGALARVGVEPVVVTARSGGAGCDLEVERHPLLPAPLSRRLELVRSFHYAGAVREVARSCQVVHGLVEP